MTGFPRALLLTLFLPLLLLHSMAHAACTNPVGLAGEMLYNEDFCVLQFCNDTNWVAMGAKPAICPTSSTCPSNGLVGHWKLDESSGTTAADAVGSNDGTLTNMDPATDWVAGKLNNALDFDGTNDTISMGDVLDNNGTTPLTCAAWVYFRSSANPGSNYIVSKQEGSSDNTGWRCLINGTSDKFYVGFVAKISGPALRNDVETQNAITTNQWNHLVGTYDGSTNASGITLYVNGSAVATNTVFDTFSGSSSTNANFRISGRDGNASYFDGQIDDVRVYDRALNAQEVSDLYNSGNGCQ